MKDDKRNNHYLKLIVILLAIFVITSSGFVKLLIKCIGVISPFITGAFIAYVINQMLILLENYWDKLFKKSSEKLRRIVCIVLSYIITIAAVVLIVMIVVPQLKNTANTIHDNLPAYIDQMQLWSTALSNKLAANGVEINNSIVDFEALKEKAQSIVINKGGAFVNATLLATSSIFSTIINIVLAIAFSIFILAGKEQLTVQFDRLLKASLSKTSYDKAVHLIHITDKSFSNFISGQLIEAVIIGFLCFIGMLILGLPYKGAISVLVGFTALIPMVGAFLGTAIGAFLILFVKPIKALWFIVFIIVLQQFEGNVIYPRVVGKSVGLPGIWVLVAIAVGGGLFGVFGMIIAVPIFSVIYELLKEKVNR